MNRNTEIFAAEIEKLKAGDNFRSLPQARHEGKYIFSDGKKMLNLSSNDYLGIVSEGKLWKEFVSTAEIGNGLPSSSSSRLLTGNFPEYEELENSLAALFGRESALVFNSGYHANTGILPALCGHDALILADKLVHASIIDGIRLSAGKCVRFRHQDIDQLESLVEKYHRDYSRVVIVTESIFSMDGDTADLKFLAGLKKRYPGVMLYVDEAHAVGVRGETGMGLAQELGVAEEIDFLCGTFGKALASVGAYVLCDSDIREFLVNRMRSFIFTTALPPLNMLWTLRVLQGLAGMGDRRRLLSRNASKLRSALASAGLTCPSESHIIPVMAGDSHRAASLAASMQKEGFYLLPIRPPTVPEGTSRLRISLTAALSNEDTDALSAALLKAVL